MQRIAFTITAALLSCLTVRCADGDAVRAPAATSVRSGGTFVIDAPQLSQIRSLDPLRSGNINTSSVAGSVFHGLLGYDPRSLDRFAPLVAESWHVSDDGTVWTFHLRRGARFHDDPCFEGGRGRAVTVVDVRYSVQRSIREGEATSPLSLRDLIVGADAFADGESDDVSGIETPNGNEIRFTLRRASNAFPHALATSAGWIVPREAVERYGTKFGRHPVGTGPFRLASWTPSSLVLVRNQHYWARDEDGVPLPYLDRVVMKSVSFRGQRRVPLSNLMDGSLHLMYFTGELEWQGFDRLSEILESRGVRSLSTPKLNTIFFGWNLDRESPWARSPELRRAVAAVAGRPDPNELLQPAAGLLPPGLPGCGSRPAMPRQDFELARELLRAAGFPEGRGLGELQIGVMGSTDYFERAFVEPLTELGIRLRVDVTPWDLHWQSLERGEHQFFRDGWIADYPDAENFFNLFYSGSPVNHTGYSDAEYDSLFSRLQTLPADAAERVEVCQRLEAILERDSPAVFLYHERSYFLVRDNVRNVELSVNPFERKFYEHVWLDGEPSE